jgi:hypothetical protein
MYNSGRRGKRANDGYGILSQADRFNQTEYPIPIVTSFAVTDGSYVPLDDTAASTAGGQTIVVYGSGFAPGATIMVGGTTISSVTYLDQGRLTFTSPANTSGSYTIIVINANGGTGILVPGLVYSGVPTWSTSAGSVGSVYERTSVSSTFVATGDAPVTYSILSGSLPPGTTLSTTGVLSGSAPAESGSTTYSFTIRATDGQLQDSDRSFSLTINTDVVSWSSPTNNQVISSYEYTPISNVTASATSAAGYGVVYSANAVPTGINLNASSGVISGTVNTVGNTYTRLTATANTTTRTAIRDVVFNINSDVVTWNTPANNYVISAYEYSAISNVTANATSAAGFGVLYSANTTPTGITLDANTGLISGTPTTVGNTYALLTATANTTTRSNTRNIIYNVNQDLVTWSSPADQTAYSLQGGSPIANVTLSATSAAGRTITYTANALPSGLAISGSVIYGTPDTAQTVTTLLTATANTTNRTATRTISWTINLGDTYWKYTSLLLSANTPTPTFINDASLNNAQLTIVGDTRPSNFDPYMGGYYSNYFDGTGDYLSFTPNSSLAIGSNAFTFEAWVYPTSSATAGIWGNGNGASANPYVYLNSLVPSLFFLNVGIAVGPALTLNRWNHVAVVRSSGTIKIYTNGVSGTGVSDANVLISAGPMTIGGASDGTQVLSGYISNLRLLNGTALYTTNFTPPTAPLTAVANTVLLTCQSNRLIDNSNNNFAITKNGDTTVSSAHPFITPTTVAYNTQYSTYFTGNTNDSVSIASAGTPLNLDGDFTVEFWILKTAYSTNGYTQYLNTGWNSQAFKSQNTGALYFYNGTSYSYTGAVVPLGTWTHIAWVRSGTSSRVYVNGTGSTTLTTLTATITWGTGTFRVGSDAGVGVGETLIGNISNLRIIKGTAIYDLTQSTITVPTAKLTAISGTSLLTCQDATLKDNSTNALTITSSGNAQPITVSPFTMTTSNTTVTSLGSAYFDGTGDYLTLPSNAAFAFGTGNFTVELWANFSNASASGLYFIDARNSGATGTWAFFRNSSNNLVWYTGSADGATASLATINTWVHLAYTRQNTTGRLFINGVLSATTTDSTNYSISPSISYIGSRYSVVELIQGYISDLRVVKGTALYTANFLPPQTPLTAVANTQLLTCQYNGGATNNGFLDQSSFNLPITRNGNTTQGTFSPYSQTGWSNYFDGTGDYWTIPDNTALQMGTGDFTLEFWYYFNSLASYQTLYSKGYTLAGGIVVQTGNGTGRLIVYASGSAVITETGTGTVGVWYHYALVRSGTTLTLYRDGVSTGTATNSTNFNNTGLVYAGDTTYPMNGYMSNLRLVKGQAVYTGAFTPPTTPLTATANTQLLTCQSNRLVDNSLNNFTITKVGDTTVQSFSPFGGVTSVPASYSLYYDYLTIPDNTAFTFGSSDFTIESWAYATARTASYIIFAQTDNSTAAGSSVILYVTSNALNALVYYGGTSYYSLVDPTYFPLNAWTHVALVRKTTTLSLYVNGTRVATTSAGTSVVNDSSATVSIYARNTQGDMFSGYLSNLRVVKGTAVYDATQTSFTVPTSPLTAVANTSLLTLVTNKFVDIGPNNLTITPGVPKITSFNPFGLTNTTQVSYSPSVNGGSMYFDGSGDYLTIPSTNLVALTADFTIELWLYLTATAGTSSGMIIHNSPASAGTYWALFVNAASSIAWLKPDGNFQALSSVLLNQWIHLAVTRSGTTIYYFLNGTLVTSSTVTTANFSTQNTVYIGGGPASYFASATSITGYISDARITKSALYTSNFYPPTTPLTPTTTIGANTYLSNLLVSGTSGGIIDYHSTNNLETVGDVKLASEDPYSGSYYSNYFDGTGDYLSIADNTAFTLGSGDFTIEYWINVPSLPSIAGYIYGQCDASATTASRNVYDTVASDGTIQTQIYFNGSSTLSITSVSTLTTGRWSHIAVVRNGTTIRQYFNGVQQGTANISTNSLNDSSSNFAIGRLGDYTSNSLLGSVSNFRIIKGTCLYPNGTAFTPSTTPLTAVSSTSLLTCQSNSFKDNSTNNFTITRNGDTKVQSRNPFQQNTGKSIYFDGTGDYLTIPVSPNMTFGSSDFTFETWVYPTDVSSLQSILYLNANTSGYAALALQIQSGALNLWMSSTGSAWSLQQGSIGTIVAGVWTHIAVTKSGTTMKVYINGTQAGTNYTVAQSLMTTYTLNQIGVYNTSSYLLTGYLKDLRITRGVRTISVPTSPLEIK